MRCMNRSSLVQIFVRFDHVDWSTSPSNSLSVKNQGIGRTSDKRKISVSWKIKIQLATASAAATLFQRCHYVWARCASFTALFSEPRRFGSTPLFSTWYVISGSAWRRHSKSYCKTPLGNMAVSTASQISRRPATSSTTGEWDVLCHILSRAEEVMRERDIHHTRAIKTNSAVNLNRKPGLTLYGILLQHLQGVLRTSRDFVFSFLVFTLSHIDFPRPITQIVFHMKFNQIYLSYFMDDNFCSILFDSV